VISCLARRLTLLAQTANLGVHKPKTVATRIYINGTISAPEDARISVLDRGFLYGDSVYEVLRTSGGQLVDLERHVVRLHESAASLALQVPDDAMLRKAVAETLGATGNAESYLRIVVTRGSGEVGLDPALAGAPTLIVIAKPLVLPELRLYQEGVPVRLVNVERTSVKAMDPSVKSGNYLNNILALAEARKSGDYEAVMCDREGFLAEGSSSNLFWGEGNKLFTPSLAVGLLAGITRRRVLELASSRGMEIHEGSFPPNALQDAAEAFLTSSIRGILPIQRVNGARLASCPGPLTRALIDDYEAFLQSEAKG
jgi:branched-chain amino acid aminotransferase